MVSRLLFKQQPAILSRVLKHRWFSWIPPKLTWGQSKAVIRCAFAAWVGFLLQLVRPTERVMGNAAFFSTVIAFMIPPALPLVQTLEIFLNLFFFASVAWGWTALGVYIAWQVRIPVDPAKIAAAREKWALLEPDVAALDRRLIFEGTYIEARSTVVLAVFLAFGTGALLWYKIHTQPSPATFPLVLSCILMDIGVANAVVQPEAYYTSGLLFFLPMAIQAGLALVSSLVIFPESVAHSFQAKFGNLLNPLSLALREVEQLFQAVSESEDKLDIWADRSHSIRQLLMQSLDGIAPLRAQLRYLRVDISYGLLSTSDLEDLFKQLAAVQARSGGLAFFFDLLVTNVRHQHLDSMAWSARDISRPGTPQDRSGANTPTQPDERPHSYFESRPSSRNASFENLTSHPLSPAQRFSHISLLDHLHRVQRPVGLWESQRYMDLERPFTNDTEDAIAQLEILAHTSKSLVASCRLTVELSMSCLTDMKRGRLSRSVTNSLQSLNKSIDIYRERRLLALESYNKVFGPENLEEAQEYRKVHYRNLFQSFVAQYHLIEFAEALANLIRIIERLQLTRTRSRVWTPHVANIFSHARASHQEEILSDETEDPEGEDILGPAKPRNPEYTPFDGFWLNIVSRLASFPDVFHTRGFMFFVKAAVLTTVTILPQFISSSASFYYYNRGIWVTILAQLTLAIYSGDTASAWVARVVASFWGALFGMAAWYIGSGASSGNPYGLGAVCAVTFPIAMFYRLHFPGQLLTAVMSTVTFGLVIGYSYLNGTVIQLTDAKWGWDVAWRRFVCVMIGITAAFVFSYIPPAYSSKLAVRHSYASVITRMGTILCGVLSQANTHLEFMDDNPVTRDAILLSRTKLTKLGARHANAQFEYSLRGRWPEERYRALLEALRDSLMLIHQLHHVLSQMDRPWRRLLLNRIRFDDPVFIGDVLAVITMCSSALSSGTPLPQITPSPLVARFKMGRTKGLDLPRFLNKDERLPSVVTIEVMASAEYMRYALGITTTFSLLSRLDRMVIICKTLLGENYHVSGLRFNPPT